jgi:hypothetical protein
MVVVGDYLFDATHLRNEFTGGYAQPVNSSSPGNFRYYQEGDKVMLEVYGAGGQVLAQYPTTATTRVIIELADAAAVQRLWDAAVHPPKIIPKDLP